MPLLILAALLWLTPMPADAQCCGDCNGDGSVTINELITAVNNALDGCPATTPTPTAQCPIDFQDNNSVPNTPDCYYRGRWNPSCGADDLETLWRTDSQFLIINLLGFNPGLFFGAEVTAAGSADLICWYTMEDASDCDAHPISGGVTLSSGGDTLTISPQSSPFDVDDCPVTHYSGTLFTVDTPTSLAASRRLRNVAPEALQRVRAAAAAHRGRPDFTRH